MTDNMTDITLKKEKINELIAKQRKYLKDLDLCSDGLIGVQQVRHWINDLVSIIVPEVIPNGLKGQCLLNGLAEHSNQCQSDCESESESVQTPTDNTNSESKHSNDFTDNSETNRLKQSVHTINTINTNNTINSNNDNTNCSESAEPIDSDYLLFTSIDAKSEDNIDSVKTQNQKSESIDSELSSEDDNCANPMESNECVVPSDCDNQIKRILRNKTIATKQSSESSEVDFDDSSDSPDSDSDSDYQLNGKSRTGDKSQRLSRNERLLKDFRLTKSEPTVALIRLTDELIDRAVNDAASASDSVIVLEKQLFDSLRSKGVVCRKMKTIKTKESKHKNKDNKSDANSESEDKEFKRLLKIPKINSTKTSDKRKGSKNGTKSREDSDESDNSESNGSDKKRQKSRKIKASTPLRPKPSNGSDSDSDCDVSNVLRNNSTPETTRRSTAVDLLDSDVSTDEEMKKKDIKSNDKKNIKNKIKSEEVNDNCDNESNGKTNDKRLRVRKTVCNQIGADLKEDMDGEDGEEEDEKEGKDPKSVIDLDSNSDEEVVHKRKANKRRVSDDDEYNDSDKQSDKESSESSEESEGMDPSTEESDVDSDDSDSKSKRKGKKGKDRKDNKKKTKGKRKRVKIDDSSDDDDCKVLSDENDSPNKSRKHIKKIISDKKLKQQTKDAAEAERDRQKRIQQKQKEYNDFIKARTLKSADVKELILEFDKESKEVLVEVDSTLVSFLKPHQSNGIQFMYDCIIETIDQIESSEGSGAILAHSMGLGKTLQVITFLYTIMKHKDIKKHIRRALVICPVNTIKNWANEFRIWLNDNDLDDLLVFEMFDAKSMAQRAELLRIWHKRGGVLIIGLTLYSSLVTGGRGKKPSKSVREAIQSCLVDPGPDVVICDEGHLLKNEKTAYNKAVSQLRTLRRVVLTGTPLQNNLIEYHVMVHFVKPNLLGTKKEFINRFVNPITNGQHVDSTDYDVKIMKKRVHILHTLLNGCVHRCDYSVLVPYLQPKHEFVISVMLSEKQCELYAYYLKNVSDRQRLSLLADYGVLRLVWNHPILLFEQHRRRIEKANDDSMDEFIDDDDDVDTPVSGDSDIECVDDNKAGPSKPPKRRMRTRYGKDIKEDEEEENDPAKDEAVDDGLSDAWFAPYLKREEAKQIELSGKFILLFAILEECEKLGDKILLFSQSLDTLDLVEEMLKIRMERAREETTNSIPEIDLETSYPNDATNVWIKNRDYFRLDGSTGSDYRKAWIDLFNQETNYRARLFLLSTKAGGLGINLVGANRCIIFDASWNPTHDVQAIFRIFRFGQKKPVYVYRFVAQGTMEEKIYERQIMKQSLSCRVVDEQSIQRHFKASELSELYAFNPADRTKERPTPKVPKDRLLAEMLIKHKDYIVGYHEHDSLLENKPEEDMTEEEKLSAWNEYENEKDALFLREQQEREARMQREYMMAHQQAEQQRQQLYQQQQQAQYQRLAQQMYQQLQNQNPQQFAAQASTDNYQSLLQNQIYQNIMKSQALLRKQQQQQYNELRAQRLRELGQQEKPSGGLPGYDRMTIEDIAKYLKNMNNAIEPQALIQRIFTILDTGLNTCSKELESVKVAMRASPSNETTTKYEKLAKEVFNLNLQKTRAQGMFKAAPNVRSGPNILRGNAFQAAPTVIDPDEFSASGSASKPSSVLIEEVD